MTASCFGDGSSKWSHLFAKDVFEGISRVSSQGNQRCYEPINVLVVLRLLMTSCERRELGVDVCIIMELLDMSFFIYCQTMDGKHRIKESRLDNSGSQC